MTLEITNLSLSLGKKPVLRRINLSFAPGLTALIGPNGSGKTSLLKAIACLLKPETGQIKWHGQELSTMSAGKRATLLGYLAQNPPVHWPILAQSLVGLGRAARNESQADTKQAVKRAMHTCNVSGFTDRPMNQLSGGERARVLLARVLCVNADILLVDEPTAALDPAQQLAMMEILKDQAHAGKTVLIVLHDLPLAARFADQVVVLDQGKTATIGTPQQRMTGPEMQQVFGLAFTDQGHVRYPRPTVTKKGRREKGDD